MKYLLFLVGWLGWAVISTAQPNCNLYKTPGNDSCYQACVLATSGGGAQGSMFSQMRFQRAIQMCPTLDYAYMEMAVPYVKRGDWAAWRPLIDKAVALNPRAHLGYRAWCRYQFLHDYEGTLEDLARLDTLFQGADIGYGVNGDYHLNVARGLCYKALGQKEKAAQAIETQLARKGYSPMMFDYLHLGVLKWELGDPDAAIECFRRSIEINDYLAEAYYYMALAYKDKGDPIAFKRNMEQAKDYYTQNRHMSDPYTHHADRIFLADIERQLKK